MKVRAYIYKDINGGSRVVCQRERRKWWFVLGAHAPTDAAFAQALRAGAVDWEPEIRAEDGLFERKMHKK